ncbi:MAG: hypothetical protein A2169_06005 [Deltaproteobacteria bacterium RBG_13_47_9]|nr:MAG: hypothetical protein A2169_06005 [Deltaproteobacteria bacterium RBG_13_47_9]
MTDRTEKEPKTGRNGIIKVGFIARVIKKVCATFAPREFLHKLSALLAAWRGGCPLEAGN